MLHPLFKGSRTRASVLTRMGDLPNQTARRRLKSLGRGEKGAFTMPTATPRVEGTSAAWAVLP